MAAFHTVFLALLLAVSQLALAQTTTIATKFEHGTLVQGQPKGTWDYFEEDGQLALRMNYDSSRISYRRPDTTRYELLVGGEWQLVRPNRPPGLLGSRLGRRAALQKTLRYPVAALQQQQQGDVLLSYVVQANGQTSDYTVLSSTAPACTQEVWRVLSSLPDQWIPAVYLGQPRAARFYLLIKFTMLTAPNLAAGQGLRPPASPSGPFTDVVMVTAVSVERRVGVKQR